MSYRFRYALFGALFGLLFPLGACLFDFLRTGFDLSPAGLVALHLANPLHFVIDTAPFFLGLFASFVGQREDRNRRYSAELEVCVAERTARLEKALFEARAADRAKSEFLANTSHEIRTPMNGILGFAELMSETPLSAEQADFLATIRRSGESLLARKMGGEIELRSEPGEGSCFRVELPLAAVRPREPRSGNLPDRQALDGIEVLVVDDLREARTLTARFCRRLGLEPREAESAEAGLEILRETGPGIRLVVSDVLMPEIDGLGLARSVRSLPTGDEYRILAVSSWVRAGAARACREAGFDAYLAKPLSFAAFRDSMLALTGHEPRPDSGDGGVAHCRDMARMLESIHVLLVEDNPVNLKLGEALLSKIGVRITTATNGLEALVAVRTGSIDLVLMDVQMPVMDGLEATRHLREEGLRVPVIAMTASAMKGDREICLQAGMDDYLSKPVNRAALHEAILRHSGETVAATPD